MFFHLNVHVGGSDELQTCVPGTLEKSPSSSLSTRHEVRHETNLQDDAWQSLNFRTTRETEAGLVGVDVSVLWRCKKVLEVFK